MPHPSIAKHTTRAQREAISACLAEVRRHFQIARDINTPRAWMLAAEVADDAYCGELSAVWAYPLAAHNMVGRMAGNAMDRADALQPGYVDAFLASRSQFAA